MTHQVSIHEQQQKLNRFMRYLLSLDEAELHNVMQHLPNEFEKEEHQTILEGVIKAVGTIFKKCKDNCCCL